MNQGTAQGNFWQYPNAAKGDDGENVYQGNKK